MTVVPLYVYSTMHKSYIVLPDIVELTRDNLAEFYKTFVKVTRIPLFKSSITDHLITVQFSDKHILDMLSFCPIEDISKVDPLRQEFQKCNPTVFGVPVSVEGNYTAIIFQYGI